MNNDYIPERGRFMHTNFDFLTKNKRFASFAQQAVEAERSLAISPATAAILSRRALELAVRWVYINCLLYTSDAADDAMNV